MKSIIIYLFAILFLFDKVLAADEDVLRPRGGDMNSKNESTESKSTNTNKTKFSFGAELGVNSNVYSQSMNGLQKDSRFYVFENGTGFSLFLGFFVDYKLTEQTGIQFKLAIDQKDFGNTKDAIRDAIRPDQSVVDAMVTGEYKTSVTYLTLTPQFRWNVSPDLFLLVGPTIHLKAGNATQDFTEKINSPEDVYYFINTPNQSKVLNGKTDNLETISTRVGLEIDLGYKYKLNQNLYLIPKIGFQYMITAFGNEETAEDDTKFYTTPPFPGTVPITATNKVLHSIQLSLGLWYNL